MDPVSGTPGTHSAQDPTADSHPSAGPVSNTRVVSPSAGSTSLPSERALGKRAVPPQDIDSRNGTATAFEGVEVPLRRSASSRSPPLAAPNGIGSVPSPSPPSPPRPTYTFSRKSAFAVDSHRLVSTREPNPPRPGAVLRDPVDRPRTEVAAGDPYFAPSGRSLRARTSRPSYLEIPPGTVLDSPSFSPPPIARASFTPERPKKRTRVAARERLEAEESDLGEEEARDASSREYAHDEGTAVELLKVSGKVVKRFKRWAKGRRVGAREDALREGGSGPGEERESDGASSGSESDLSSLEDDEPIKFGFGHSASDAGARGRGRGRGRGGGGGRSRGRGRGRGGRPKGSTRAVLEARAKEAERLRNRRSESTLSSLSDSDAARSRHKRRRRRDEQDDGDSSSLSSLESSPEPTPRVLPFPTKPSSHPLNSLVVRPRPTRPPTHKHLADLNPLSWAEGIREVTMRGEIVPPTWEEDLIALMPPSNGGGAKKDKKRPGWDWEIDLVRGRSESPAVLVGPAPTLGSTLANPPDEANDAAVLGDTSRSGSAPPAFVAVGNGLRRTARVAPKAPLPSSVPPSATVSTLAARPPPLASTALVSPALPFAPTTTAPPYGSFAVASTLSSVPIARPKTYRQRARLDWAEFHQRNRCRFTTSGAIEGVNPDNLPWEDWFGIEDEGVERLRRENGIAFGSTSAGLVVLDRATLENVSGVGSDRDFERIRADVAFENGMELRSEWRFKTLDEGMGRALESRCRWAVRNPEQRMIYEESEHEEEVGAAKGKAKATMPNPGKVKRRREKKERKKRVGSGGESDLTPLEGDDSDSSSLSSASDSDAVPVPRASAGLRAKTNLGNSKGGTLVRCPVETCPQRFYRSKAASSVSTHNRHYHTPFIVLKYSTGISAYISRNDNGDFVCPTPACGFTTKSRGTMAVHGKPHKCHGPPVSIPKPANFRSVRSFALDSIVPTVVNPSSVPGLASDSEVDELESSEPDK
ncbi:hypothetical protein JCM10212_006877 [Sporobolomyces blumeae]